MTKGDRDKLRAELAGKAMAAMICSEFYATGGRTYGDISGWAVNQADALMSELGLSLDKEPEHDPTLRNPTIEEIIGED